MARYLFSREHDVIEKWQKFAELTGGVSRIFNQVSYWSRCRVITLVVFMNPLMTGYEYATKPTIVRNRQLLWQAVCFKIVH